MREARQRRCEPKQDSREHRHADVEEKHERVRLNVVTQRQVSGTCGDQRVDSPGSEEITKGACGDGQQDTLRQQLSYDSRTACSERCANCHFPCPSRCSREHQVCYVRACDQKDTSDARKQHQDSGSHVADSLLMQRNNINTPTGVEFGILAFQPCCDGAHFSLRLGERYSGLHACNRSRASAGGCAVVAAGLKSHRYPYLCLAVCRSKRGRHDARDCGLSAVERDRLPHDVRARSKPAHPKLVTDHGERRSTELVLFLGERASDQRLDAERVEEILADTLRDQFFRLTGADDDAHGQIVEDRHPLEHTILRFPVEEVRG